MYCRCSATAAIRPRRIRLTRSLRDGQRAAQRRLKGQEPSLKLRLRQNSLTACGRIRGLQCHPRTTTVIARQVRRPDRLRQSKDPKGDDMKSWAPVVEPPFHGTPCENVLAVESPQRLEIGDLGHRSHLGVEV